ncbi:MAG: NAD-dependent succinate-semialdehyde dehydrogenase [Janthinobacterium lividum]
MAIATINPATGETIKTFTPLTDTEVGEKLARASHAFQHQRQTSFAERSAYMKRVGKILDTEKHTIAAVMTLEVGKTFKASVAEVEKCATACRYYAENAERFLADQAYEIEGAKAFVRYRPLGVVLAIMPWNFPLWQVIRFAAPALMAGNVGLLKHADNVPQCAMILEDVFLRAGFPDGTFQALLIETPQIAAVIDDPRVVAATLTGSERAGIAVGSQAGAKIKKTVLELGGSDPFIVMPSADLDTAVKTAVQARTLNNGQSCIAAKRFILHETIADEFTQKFIAYLEALTIGDPMDPQTDIGPLATPKILGALEAQVDQSVTAGATLLTGGKRLDKPGSFYPPTALSNIPQSASAYSEELFGPVALLFRVKDLDDAIRQANDTPYGLGSSVWTNDPIEQQRFIDEIEAGMTFVNSMVASDPRLPFGGIKHSGYGRELSEHGIREFVNLKTIFIASGKKSGRDVQDTE